VSDRFLGVIADLGVAARPGPTGGNGRGDGDDRTRRGDAVCSTDRGHRVLLTEVDHFLVPNLQKMEDDT